MLTNAQEKLLRSLQTKKGRAKSGLCLVEGQKVIESAGEAMEWQFTRADVLQFDGLVTTDTPQDLAGVARIPAWQMSDVREANTILVLDGVQDPGNVGALLRLCLGFRGALLLVDSVDVTNPKVVRSSVGALFSVPWMTISRNSIEEVVAGLGRPVYRLERGGVAPDQIATGPAVLIVGSEGQGIQLGCEGVRITIPHDARLESLNVGHAVAIALYARG